MKFLKKFFQCIFYWKLEPSSKGELKDSDVILALSFGRRENTSGMSNIQLALGVEMLALEFGLPVITQWEISERLTAYIDKAGEIREHRIKGKYLDTREMLIQSLEICKKRNWKKAVIVAHPDHVWRCAETAKKLGFETVIADTAYVEYDEQSVQPWTRSRARFVPREIAARLLFLFKGWI